MRTKQGNSGNDGNPEEVRRHSTSSYVGFWLFCHFVFQGRRSQIIIGIILGEVMGQEEGETGKQGKRVMKRGNRWEGEGDALSAQYRKRGSG